MTVVILLLQEQLATSEQNIEGWPDLSSLTSRQIVEALGIEPLVTLLTPPKMKLRISGPLHLLELSFRRPFVAVAICINSGGVTRKLCAWKLKVCYT